MREYAPLMAFVLYFPISISCLRVLRRGYLFQRLHKTRSYSLKEHSKAVFLTREDLLFCLVAGSI